MNAIQFQRSEALLLFDIWSNVMGRRYALRRETSKQPDMTKKPHILAHRLYGIEAACIRC